MRRVALGVFISIALIAGAGCASGERSGAPQEEEPSRSSGDFYDVPDDLGRFEPGELIRHAEAKKTSNGVLYRVMYASESLGGDPIAVTGLVAVPSAAAPSGGRPVLGYAHWTTGLADECAPSRTLDGATVGIIDLFMARGMVVAATDYEGLGTPGLHPYLVGESEARGVLDSIRAARSLPGSGASAVAVAAGHSQGGHAALFTAELAKEWAPEIDLRGAAAGAPPSEFGTLSRAVGDGSTLGYFAMIAAGINAATPTAELDAILTDEAIEIVGIADQACTAEVLNAFAGKTLSDVVAAEPTSVPEWGRAIEAIIPGRVKTDVPLFVFHGADDELVPASGSEVLSRRLCSLSQTIELKVYPGQSHGGVVTAALGDLSAWLEARLAGEPAVSTCAAPA